METRVENERSICQPQSVVAQECQCQQIGMKVERGWWTCASEVLSLCLQQQKKLEEAGQVPFAARVQGDCGWVGTVVEEEAHGCRKTWFNAMLKRKKGMSHRSSPENFSGSPSSW